MRRRVLPAAVMAISLSTCGPARVASPPTERCGETHGPICADPTLPPTEDTLALLCDALAPEAGESGGGLEAHIEMTACRERPHRTEGPCPRRSRFERFARCVETVARAHVVSCRRGGREVVTTYAEVHELWLERSDGCWEHTAVHNPYRAFQGVLVGSAGRAARLSQVRAGGRFTAVMRLEGRRMTLPVEVQATPGGDCPASLAVVDPPGGLRDRAGRSWVSCGPE